MKNTGVLFVGVGVAVGVTFDVGLDMIATIRFVGVGVVVGVGDEVDVGVKLLLGVVVGVGVGVSVGVVVGAVGVVVGVFVGVNDGVFVGMGVSVGSIYPICTDTVDSPFIFSASSTLGI